ncbi:hypothetical protein RBB78_00165 [Tunturiibacter empetritectus]|uniref:hypothetical protein n=1 Tax=Tunturiibacter empetritectus TaxID=3069691 RepID=UPI003D9BACE7
MTGNAHHYHRGRPVFFAGFFIALFATFLAATAAFLATFFAGVFFAVFVVTIFFAAFLEDVFLGAFFAAVFFAGVLTGADFRTSVTVVTAAPIAVLMAPATSDAIAIPTPTVSPALSATVFSAILKPRNLCVPMLSRIVEGYRDKRTGQLQNLTKGQTTLKRGFCGVEHTRRVLRTSILPSCIRVPHVIRRCLAQAVPMTGRVAGYLAGPYYPSVALTLKDISTWTELIGHAQLRSFADACSPATRKRRDAASPL